jgi:tripartite-type tricarboxylate transporter receptor subunit TctC
MKRLTIVTGFLLAAACSASIAQTFPTKPLRIVVPWPPGGGNDLIARWLAPKLTESLGQQVVVDNRGGQNGVIGADHVAKSPPDGYTMMVHTVTGHMINPAFYGKLPYDTERDFAPITLIASVPHTIVAHPSLPVKTLKDLIALAKKRPGELNFASFGNGSTSHLSGEMFNAMTGVKLVHIPYKGGGPALIDTLAGHVPLYFSSLPTALPSIKAGRLRGLAVTGAQRSKQMPEMPTVDEAAGTKGYVSEVMYGILAPAGVPGNIIGRLNRELVKAINAPDIRERLASIGTDDPVANTPEQMAAYMRGEMPKWAKLVRASGAKPN